MRTGKTMKYGLTLTETAIGDPVVYAIKPDRQIIGRLVMCITLPWRPNLIKMVQVHPDYQRQGIATAMWNYAKERGLKPAHELEKTPEGEAWAKAVGE